jgi:hypothetical protein
MACAKYMILCYDVDAQRTFWNIPSWQPPRYHCIVTIIGPEMQSPCSLLNRLRLGSQHRPKALRRCLLSVRITSGVVEASHARSPSPVSRSRLIWRYTYLSYHGEVWICFERRRADEGRLPGRRHVRLERSAHEMGAFSDVSCAPRSRSGFRPTSLPDICRSRCYRGVLGVF